MLKQQSISVDKLYLDSCNPRLPCSLHGKNEVEIIEYLLLDASLIELMQAIGENDFFAGEQLLVVKRGSSDEFEVVEGNRRLAAVKLLKNPNLTKVQRSKVQSVYDNANYHPSEIPCLIFEDKKTILKYLGYRHVTGIKPWKSLEKARYLDTLKETLDREMSFEQKCIELAKMIGSRNDYVRRILIGFRIYKYIEENRFFDIAGLDDTRFYFANLMDSLNRPNIAIFLGIREIGEYVPEQEINYDHIKEWTHWLYEKNDQNKTRLIGTSDRLSALNNVIANEDALKAFCEGKSLDDALLLTEEVDAMFFGEIQKAINALVQADSVTHKVNNYYSDLVKDLKSITELCRKINAVKVVREKEGKDIYEL